MRAYLIAVCLCLASFLLPASLAARQQDMSTTAFDFHFPSIEGGQLHLSDYQGKVLLVVNTASQCGFTPQYTALQAIWSEYRDKGLVVIGVPSDDFGGQELDSEQQVKEFCEVNFDIDFPLSTITEVKGKNAHELFKWAELNYGKSATPKWNFHKILINKEGKIEDTFTSFTKPMSKKLINKIENIL